MVKAEVGDGGRRRAVCEASTFSSYIPHPHLTVDQELGRPWEYKNEEAMVLVLGEHTDCVYVVERGVCVQ
jgi:hypothetical protein